MSAEKPWARHYQHEWQERAGDRRLPYWLRVAALAYGSHADNGHARFKRGEVALVLGELDKETGEIRPYANTRRAIDTAVEYGWLEPDSFWGCLVVPAHAIKKGQHGRRRPCPIHVKRQERQSANHSLSERKGRHSPTLSERFKPRSAHSVSGSQREPSLSSLHWTARSRTPPTTTRWRWPFPRPRLLRVRLSTLAATRRRPSRAGGARVVAALGACTRKARAHDQSQEPTYRPQELQLLRGDTRRMPVAPVNAGRKLTPFRRLKIDPPGIQFSLVVDPGTRPRSRSLSR